MTKKPETKVIRYIFAGGLTYLVEMLIILGLKDGAKFSAIKSVAISFWIALVISFLLQKIVTFRNHDKRIHIIARQIIAFGVLVLFNYGLTLLTVKIFTPRVSVFVIRTLIILLATIWNYYFYNLLFKQPSVE